MSDNLRVPSQEELERLEEAVRLDPASRHFVTLGEAYLALGRPRDAVQIGARGLQADPANMRGRLMVGMALVALHQWKQAQVELLKVVKADKQNGDGFRLLGEVLMRRSDYERALPVLQHAQNLDPANPAVLALLKRARAGKALDPPPPIPSPRPPRGARARLPKPAASPASVLDELPTRVAPDPASMSVPDLDDADTGTMSLDDDTRPELQAAPPAEIRDRLPLPSSAVAPERRPPPAPRRDKRPSAAPPVRPKVQPRINPAERRADAAREGLRQSAAMGEDYLNNLLRGGLLEVPNVRASDEVLEFKVDKSMSPSAKRAFVFLFTLLFLGTAGGVSWYIYAAKEKAAQVAKRVDAATLGVQSGSYQDFVAAAKQTTEAMEIDDKSIEATAAFAMVGALQTLLYRTDGSDAEYATTGARKFVEAGDAGDRQLIIAEAAIKLARLPDMQEPRVELAQVKKQLETQLASGDDGWLRWLYGRALLAAGDRTGAAEAFRQAEQAPSPPLVATIDRADMLVDEGVYDQAQELYDKVLKEAPDHPLAIIGQSLLRAETSRQLAEAVDDLNVKLTGVESVRVDGYKNLAFAYARYSLQDFADFRKHLETAIGVMEPRFWARVGMLRLRAGLIKEAVAARDRVVWYGPEDSKPEPDPLVQILDAELSLTLGFPQSALGKVGKGEGLRIHTVRGLAHFDRGEYSEAISELDKALAIAPDDRELNAFKLTAVALSGKGKERREALKDLGDLRLSSKSKVPSYLEGVVLLARGKLDDARYTLEKAVDNITEEEPNRLLYRAHLALAEVYFRKESMDKAIDQINKSLEINRAYLPTQALMGRVELGRENWPAAVEALGRVVVATEENVATWQIELGFAEATMKAGEPGADGVKAATEAVLRAKEKGASDEELARVAALIGPELLEQLGLEAPPDEDESPKKKRRRRH